MAVITASGNSSPDRDRAQRWQQQNRRSLPESVDADAEGLAAHSLVISCGTDAIGLPVPV